MFNENVRVSLADQLVEKLSGRLRSVYIDATELPTVEKKILVKFIVKEYLQSIRSDWKTSDNVTAMLDRLQSTFNASRGLESQKLVNYARNSHRNVGMIPDVGVSREGKIGKLQQDDEVLVDLLHRMQAIFYGDTTRNNKPVSKNEAIIDQGKLECIVSVAERLEKRFQSTGLPLLSILEKLDDVLAAKDSSFSVAIKASFDRIIDSLDPNNCGQSLNRENSNDDLDFKVKLFDTMSEKHALLGMYHKQGRLVKDCKVMYKQQLKKYSL